MDRYNDVIGQAEDEININEVRRATTTILEMIPSVVEITKKVYDEMITKGFNEKQAYKFACEYTLNACCRK